MYRHIRTKILIIILPVVFLTILFSTIVSVNSGKSIINGQIQEKINAMQLAQISIIESKLDCAKDLSEDIAVFVAESYSVEQLSQYEDMLGRLIQKDAFILGAGIWFEPYAYKSTEEYIGPYVFKDGKTITTTYDYSNSEYDYFSQDYYKQVKNTKNRLITSPYYDQTTGVYMLTCSTPILDEKGNFLGCATVDIHLDDMQNLVSTLGTIDGGSAFLIDSNGVYLASNVVGHAEGKFKISEEENESLNAAGREILRKDSGTISFISGKESFRLFYQTIPGVNWKLVFQISDSTILSPVYNHVGSLVFIGAFSLIVLLGSILLIVARSIAAPIRVLMTEFEMIANREYDSKIPPKLTERKDELGVLARTLSSMELRLKQSQQEIEDAFEENVAAREELMKQNELLRTSEEQLRESTNYNHSIIQVMPDIVFIISKEGIFLDCQGSNNKQLLVPKEQFIGKSIHEVMPKRIADLGMEKIKEAFENGTLQHFEYEIEMGGQSEYFEMRIFQYEDDKVVAIARKITEQTKHIMQIKYLNSYDQITQLHNRRYFDEQLVQLDVSDLLPLGVIFADVNGLKIMNDSFGHSVGDLLLKKCAKVLQKFSFGDSEFARIGGDEFALILPHTNQEELERIVSEICIDCEKETINMIPLSVSCGWAIKLNKEQPMREILKAAEDMMYNKKMFEAPSRRGKTIEVIISTLQEKNPREEQHSHRVAELCVELANALALSNNEMMKIRSAGLLHDIGKIGIPEDLLNKPGKLTQEEYQMICKHPEIGYRILQSASDMGEIADIILAHHERWDGKGYPRGLQGEEIPYISRMVAIADTYDAMTSERSYRMPLSENEAAQEIIKNAGTQFDPELAYRFVYDVLNARGKDMNV